MLFFNLLTFLVKLHYCSEVNLSFAPSEFFSLKKQTKNQNYGTVSHILFLLLSLFSDPYIKKFHYNWITFAFDVMLIIK